MRAAAATATSGLRWPFLVLCALALGWLAPAMAADNSAYRPGPVDYQALPQLTLPPLQPLPSNGLARTPPMGWNSWNRFATGIDQNTVREIADAMVGSGMRPVSHPMVWCC